MERLRQEKEGTQRKSDKARRRSGEAVRDTENRAQLGREQGRGCGGVEGSRETTEPGGWGGKNFFKKVKKGWTWQVGDAERADPRPGRGGRAGIKAGVAQTPTHPVHRWSQSPGHDSGEQNTPLNPGQK